MSANPVVISDGHAAAERCRPYMDKARTSFLEACKKIGKEYAALPDDEKKVFRDDLGLGHDTVRTYARIAERGEAKLELIQGVNAFTPNIPPSIRTWNTIVQTPDEILEKAAQKGLFTDYEVTQNNISRFSKTGQLPTIKKSEKSNPTALQKIKAEFQRAEKAVNTAAGCIGQVHHLMEEEGISDIKGPEVVPKRIPGMPDSKHQRQRTISRTLNRTCGWWCVMSAPRHNCGETRRRGSNYSMSMSNIRICLYSRNGPMKW